MAARSRPRRQAGPASEDDVASAWALLRSRAMTIGPGSERRGRGWRAGQISRRAPLCVSATSRTTSCTRSARAGSSRTRASRSRMRGTSSTATARAVRRRRARRGIRPLWTLLVALFYAIGVDGWISAKIMGAVLGMATLPLVWLLAGRYRGLDDRARRSAVDPSLLAASPQFVVWNTRPENSLFCFARRRPYGSTEAESAEQRPLSALLFVLLANTHPRGSYGVVAWVAVLVVAIREGRWARLVVWSLLFAVWPLCEPRASCTSPGLRPTPLARSASAIGSNPGSDWAAAGASATPCSTRCSGRCHRARRPHRLRGPEPLLGARDVAVFSCSSSEGTSLVDGPPFEIQDSNPGLGALPHTPRRRDRARPATALG